MSINKIEKIEETFKHIHDNWKEEYYQTCELEWENIISFISKEPTPYQCGHCNTFWTKVTYIDEYIGNIYSYNLSRFYSFSISWFCN